MEIEKAIEIMKQHIQTCEENQKDENINFMIIKGFLSALDRYAFIEHEKEQQEAYDTVIEACEKQIGKKPTHKFIGNSKIHPDYDDSGIKYYCPACGRMVGFYMQDRGVYSLKFEYCHECGQRIDWSEEQ